MLAYYARFCAATNGDKLSDFCLVLRGCGGTPHALLGSEGMRLWAVPWRHALLLRLLRRRLLHQGRLA
jgi:hypothetical protein